LPEKEEGGGELHHQERPYTTAFTASHTTPFALNAYTNVPGIVESDSPAHAAARKEQILRIMFKGGKTGVF
jgi:hypothetical protein